jgi:hypothetical protein
MIMIVTIVIIIIIQVRNIPLVADEAALYRFFEQYGRVAQVQIGFRCSEYVRHFERWKKCDVELTETRVHLSLLADQDDAPESARAKRAAKMDSILRETAELASEMARLQVIFFFFFYIIVEYMRVGERDVCVCVCMCCV